MDENYKIKKTKYCKIVNYLCIIILTVTFVFLMIQYLLLPDKIPMHYNFNGEVDRYGNKWEIWIAYIAGIILYFGLSVIESKPQYLNTGITITEKNKQRIYQLLYNMLITIKLQVVSLFMIMSVFSSLQIGNFSINLLILGVIVITMILYFYKIFKAK